MTTTERQNGHFVRICVPFVTVPIPPATPKRGVSIVPTIIDLFDRSHSCVIHSNDQQNINRRLTTNQPFSAVLNPCLDSSSFLLLAWTPSFVSLCTLKIPLPFPFFSALFSLFFTSFPLSYIVAQKEHLFSTSLPPSLAPLRPFIPPPPSPTTTAFNYCPRQ